MGVKLSGIIQAEPKKMRDFNGWTIAIDAYNTLYQFLSIIRQPDGTPLVDRRGRVTSHLSGVLYRTTNLIENGIKPVYVFDGKPDELKNNTIAQRKAVKEKAKEEYEKAIEEGDLEKARMKAQQTSKLTWEMVDETKRLLELMGIPYVQAPSEGEAQASYMSAKGDVNATASQDYDSLLFGAPKLIRNLTITGRRKLPRKRIYVNIEPEIIHTEKNLQFLGITRKQLVDIAILVGTDFNEGIRGIGPKKALKLIQKYGTLENVIKNKGYEIPNYERVREIFLNPKVTDDYELKWNGPNADGIKEYLCKERDFSENRVSSAINRLIEARKKAGQTTLDAWL
jgi:flap endonuclease-1